MTEQDLCAANDAAPIADEAKPKKTRRKKPPKPRVIVCCVCRRGPTGEDARQALFSTDLARFCVEHLPGDELRRRLERHQRGDVILDHEVNAVFRRRAETASP